VETRSPLRLYCGAKEHALRSIGPLFKASLYVGSVLTILVLFGSFATAQDCLEPPSGMTGWWPGDGNADDIQDDNNGTLQNGATFDSGLVDQAFRFTASLNSGVRIPSSASLNPTDAITLDAWVFPFSFPNGAPSILRREGNAGSTQYLIAVGDGNITGVASCNIGDFAGGTGGVVVLNQWTHVACTYDRQFVRLYVNGVEVAAQAATQPIPAVSHELWIGNHERFIRQFDGLIDEVEIFNRALSNTEIEDIYLAGILGKCKIIVEYVGQTDCNSSDSGFDKTSATPNPRWLSVAVGQTTQVAQAVITPVEKASDVDFQSADPSRATVSPATATRPLETLSVTGIAVGTPTTIDASVDGNVLESLSVAVYQKRTVTVAAYVINPKHKPEHPKGGCLKPNPGITKSSLQSALNRIWDQAAIEFIVTRFDEKTVDFDGIDRSTPNCAVDPPADNIGPEEQAIIAKAHDSKADIHVYYVHNVFLDVDR
jgi:hypothetical protein